MAYNLLSRLGGRGEGSVMPGDRVALVYPNCDPVSFMCALYACLQAGLVPVPIEVPLSRRDAGSQQVSKLLIPDGSMSAQSNIPCYTIFVRVFPADVYTNCIQMYFFVLCMSRSVSCWVHAVYPWR